MSKSVYFSVYLDGTANSKDNDTPEGGHTNVARLFELDAAQGTNLSLNSDHAPLTYDPTQYLGQSEKIYLDGVGSQKSSTPVALLERGTGLGGQERIEQAYDAFVAFYNKNQDHKIDVNLIGFSRGAAQARALANEIIDRGVPMLDSDWKPTREYLVPPGQVHVNKLGIFDTVASYGIPITDSHPNKNLEISKNVDSTTHLVAMHEYRATFPLTSALRNDDNSRIEEVKFAGAHSQVGGGYRNDVLAAGPLAFMYDSLKSAGIEMGPMPPEELKRIEQYNAVIKDPQRLQEALIDSRLFKGNEAFTPNPDGSFTRINNEPFPTERGTLLPFRRQSAPFDQPVNGRKVIFENDDSLGHPLVQRIGRKLGEKFFAWDEKAQSASSMPDDPAGSNIENRLATRKAEHASVLAAQSHAQVAELSSLLASSKPEAEHLQRLGLEAVPVPKSDVSANYAVVRIDPEGSSAFADLGFEYEASRIVAEAADGALARAPLAIGDPFLLHDTNGNVVGALEAVHEAPSFTDARGVLVAIDMRHVGEADQAGFLSDGLQQAAAWIAERPEGTLKDAYEIPGADGKPLARAMIACPVEQVLERTVAWDAPEP
ncbi:hypothetical protein J2W83_001727 [Pseudomonas hunanensis]|uniref:Uncharacterized protein n=1 Tax=Pseudomonas hunanensis TaxID=1247546 RepID=A0ACC6K115_9PSED|nr:DUF2235 domain-containing protein [Pseudomonas hunanensis]MDR6712132.1 hypothetical protein [Pseudomonas hunanensis]